MGSSTLPPDAGAKGHAQVAASNSPHGHMFSTQPTNTPGKGSAPTKPTGGHPPNNQGGGSHPTNQGAYRGGSK